MVLRHNWAPARWQLQVLMAAAGLCTISTAEGAQYKLAYWYEVGGNQNANGCVGCSCTGTGNHSLYVHVVDTTGAKLGNIRVEDADFPGFFGITNNDPNDKLGFCEIPIPSNNSPRAKVNDSGQPSDITVEMIEQRFPTWGHYSWECAFMRVPDGMGVTFDSTVVGTPNINSSAGNAGCILNAPFTRSCAYYDLDPFNWSSDVFQIDSSASSYGQTFVANGNRVVIAKFQTTIGSGQKLRYGVRIRENGPGGTILGAPAVSRIINSDEYFTVIVTWPISGASAVEVVPGQTYYAEVYRADTGGNLNTYRRNNVYPNGQMYRAGTPVSGSDLVGRIVCATLADPVPRIQLSTTSLSPSAVQCSAPADQSFTVTNSGLSTLNYSISANKAWVRTAPSQGAVVSGQTQTVSVQYRVQGLPAGAHQAVLTVSDPAAANSPQQITITLNVIKPLVAGDFDNDCDVDQSDFGYFQSCMTGAGNEVMDLNCLKARLDADVDVDADDFSIFQACLSGANVPGDPGCAPN